MGQPHESTNLLQAPLKVIEKRKSYEEINRPGKRRAHPEVDVQALESRRFYEMHNDGGIVMDVQVEGEYVRGRRGLQGPPNLTHDDILVVDKENDEDAEELKKFDMNEMLREMRACKKEPAGRQMKAPRVRERYIEGNAYCCNCEEIKTVKTAVLGQGILCECGHDGRYCSFCVFGKRLS
jgi:hypothetical protein